MATLAELGDRIDALTRKVTRRDEIMAKLLRGEISAQRAIELMQEMGRSGCA